jgi:DNA polymerase-3 subunit epsilon
MKVTCPNPGCALPVNRPAAEFGRRVDCPGCGLAFVFAPRSHDGEDFVIYDLETTGLYPDHDDLIQIAAVRFRAGCVLADEPFFSFARPRRPISPFIESYTGVGNRHVRDAPPPGEVLAAFSEWAGDATLIAHNGLRFDSKFLTATAVRHGGPSREIQCIDSIHISKLLFGNARGTGHSLDHVTSRLRLSTHGIRRHDARGDVELLALAVAEMWRRLGLDPAFNGVSRHPAHLPQRPAC